VDRIRPVKVSIFLQTVLETVSMYNKTGKRGTEKNNTEQNKILQMILPL
jgi:hypothetical protein